MLKESKYFVHNKKLANRLYTYSFVSIHSGALHLVRVKSNKYHVVLLTAHVPVSIKIFTTCLCLLVVWRGITQQTHFLI